MTANNELMTTLVDKYPDMIRELNTASVDVEVLERLLASRRDDLDILLKQAGLTILWEKYGLHKGGVISAGWPPINDDFHKMRIIDVRCKSPTQLTCLVLSVARVTKTGREGADSTFELWSGMEVKKRD